MILPLLAQLATASPAPPPDRPVASASAPTRAVAATRTMAAPVIDGRASDDIWTRAPRTAGFRQFSPKIDLDPAMVTEFQVAYDAKNLYVFVRMHDPHPDSIMHALSRRDVRGPSDQIKLIIDSYGDRRTGYEFAVNPDGVKRDYAITNDAEEDDAWNGIWDVATTVDADGWTAEYLIPLSQLRYAGGGSHIFGLGIWRDIERMNERDSWPLYDQTKNGLVSQLGQLTQLDGITSARMVELSPYVLTRNLERAKPGDPFARTQGVTAGADLKLGITPNITLDATVNPDFGQVEADPSVLNLTAFETFFPERRPFFVAGTGDYQFRLNCYIVVDCSTNEGLFYSRRIGRAPSLGDRFGDAGTPTATPIAFAGKLTGRTGGGLSFGLLDAYTQRVGGTGGRTAEPGTNYMVLRTKQDLRGGESDVTLIGTAVNRRLDALSDDFLHREAYVAGASTRHRFHRKEYEFNAQVTGSRLTGTADALLRTQNNSVHYLQQPGNRDTVDASRTSLTGFSGQVKFGKYGGGITRFETSLERISSGYDVNDIGYLQRADLTDWSTWGALTFQNARGIYNWMQLNANHWERWNTAGVRLSNAVNLNGHLGTRRNWDFHLGGTFDGLTPLYCDRCARGGPVVRRSAGFYPWAGFNSDSRKVVSSGVFANLQLRDDGHSSGIAMSPYVAVRASSRFQVNIGSDISIDHDDAQWLGNFRDTAGVTHYAFAHLNQRTLSLSTRFNYTITPALTVEFYGSPFVSTGTYSKVRELSSTPRAAAYDDRYRSYAAPPDADTAFTFTQLRTSAVMRWEYRPGSTLFVVWSHGRSDASGQNLGQSWVRDYRDLFSLHPDNTFVVKASYLFRR